MSEDVRDFGRELMSDEKVKGVKLSVFMQDGRYTEYNNHFDPLFKKKEEEKQEE